MTYHSEKEFTDEILAKPEPKYRHSYYINELVKSNCYYQVDILDDIKEGLFKFGDNALVDRFRQRPFGYFIGWGPRKSYGGVLNSILSRSIHSKLGIGFHIRGRKIKYTHKDHALITRLKFGLTTFDPSTPRNPRRSRLWHVVYGGANKSARTALNL